MRSRTWKFEDTFLSLETFIAIKIRSYPTTSASCNFVSSLPGPFSFIQDLSSVTASDTCKIIKMKPPRKGDHNQATLEESFGAGAS